MDKKIIELETKISFQEHMIEELNKALVEQGNRIDRLERQLKQFREQVTAGAFIKKPEEETPPPHY